MINKLKLFIVITILGISSLILTPAGHCQGKFYSAQVKDVSDRLYGEAVGGLFDKAKESTVISMYIIRLGDSDREPVNRLMKDLEEVLEREVEVEIYLNTKPDASHSLKNAKEGKDRNFI